MEQELLEIYNYFLGNFQHNENLFIHVKNYLMIYFLGIFFRFFQNSLKVSKLSKIQKMENHENSQKSLKFQYFVLSFGMSIAF